MSFEETVFVLDRSQAPETSDGGATLRANLSPPLKLEPHKRHAVYLDQLSAVASFNNVSPSLKGLADSALAETGVGEALAPLANRAIDSVGSYAERHVDAAIDGSGYYRPGERYYRPGEGHLRPHELQRPQPSTHVRPFHFRRVA